MAITREDIINAAEALERDGEGVTMASVREFLGSGSFATISPVLREWKDSRKTTQNVVLELPGALKGVLEKLGAEFWQTASRLSNEKLVTVQAEAESTVAEARAERDESLGEVARLETELEGLNLFRERCTQLQEDVIRLQEKLAASQTESGRLRDDLLSTTREKDRQSDEASRLLGVNGELKREADELRQENKALTRETGDLQGQVKQLEKTLAGR